MTDIDDAALLVVEKEEADARIAIAARFRESGLELRADDAACWLIARIARDAATRAWDMALERNGVGKRMFPIGFPLTQPNAKREG